MGLCNARDKIPSNPDRSLESWFKQYFCKDNQQLSWTLIFPPVFLVWIDKHLGNIIIKLSGIRMVNIMMKTMMIMMMVVMMMMMMMMNMMMMMICARV